MSKSEKNFVSSSLKGLELDIDEFSDFNIAHVTSGGVSLKEIDHKTMKSKLIKNLFFAGEMMDIDGKSGGFNLQSCWSTGYLAGKGAI